MVVNILNLLANLLRRIYKWDRCLFVQSISYVILPPRAYIKQLIHLILVVVSLFVAICIEMFHAFQWNQFNLPLSLELKFNLNYLKRCKIPKQLLLVIKDVGDEIEFSKEFYIGMIELAKKENRAINQILIETKRGIIYCYGPSSGGANLIA